MPRITKKAIRLARLEQVKAMLMEEMSDEDAAEELADDILKGSENGLELNDSNFEEWLGRIRTNMVWLTHDDYSMALIRALWNCRKFAGTDYGSSRQRDMGQKWTDTARGYLGETAFCRLLHARYGVEAMGDTTRGPLEDYLAKDIVKVKKPGEEWRENRVKLSVKATKFNGRWLDVPGAQIDHSDIYALVKLGVTTDHFMSYLKAADYFAGSLFPNAVERGELTEEESQTLLDEIPDFDIIPAYISGYIDKGPLNLDTHPINFMKFSRSGRKKVVVKITQGVGVFNPANIRAYPGVAVADPTGTLDIVIDPIIKSLADQHFFAHSGSLKYAEADWRTLIARM